MAPLPVIADTYRVVWDWSTAIGLSATNVFHIRAATGDEDDIDADIEAAGDLDMFLALYNGANIAVQSIQKLDGTSAARVYDAPLWGSGGGAGDAIPQAAAIVKETTALRGPSHRGRLYLPFVSEGSQNGGFINTGITATMQTAWEAFRDNMATASKPMVVASYVHSTAQDLTGVRVEGIIGTQKRRVDRLR
jgi:hypothetical protein